MALEIRPDEITKLIRERITGYEAGEADLSEVGTVLEIADGIARVHGLENCMSMEMLEHARHDIETETRLALERIRKEVADLTVVATEKVTRKTLTSEDQRRLVQEALNEVDFTVLESGKRGNGR